MIDFKVLEYLAQQGGGYAFASFIFFFYRRDILKKLEETKAEKEILIDVVSETKIAIQELTHSIRNSR